MMSLHYLRIIDLVLLMIILSFLPLLTLTSSLFFNVNLWLLGHSMLLYAMGVHSYLILYHLIFDFGLHILKVGRHMCCLLFLHLILVIVPVDIMLVSDLLWLLTLPSSFSLLWQLLLLPRWWMLHHDAMLLLMLKVWANVLFLLRLGVLIEHLLFMLNVVVSLSWRWRDTMFLLFNWLPSFLSSSLVLNALLILEHSIKFSSSFFGFL
jgi:hypothetical protein